MYLSIDYHIHKLSALEVTKYHFYLNISSVLYTELLNRVACIIGQAVILVINL